MPKTAFASFGRLKFAYLLPLHLLHLLKNHLSNAVAGVYSLCFVTKIYQDHFYFAAVIAVNSAGRVQTGKSLLYSKPAAWPYLRFPAIGYFKRQTGCYQCAF